MRAVWEMDYAGEYCVTTADLEVDGGVDYSTATFTAMQGIWSDLAFYLSDQLTLRVMKLDGVAQTASAAGQQTAPGLPGNCALRVIKNTVLKPGSMNLPGLLEAQVDAGGIIAGGALEGFNVQAATALADWETYGGTMVLRNGALSRSVNSLTCSARIGTFRNRMYGR